MTVSHVESLESRQFLSAAPIAAPTAGAVVGSVVVQRHTHTRVAKTQNFVIAFYGLGGTGFGNDWVSRIADTAGTHTGSVVRKYQQDQGDTALLDFFASVDSNGDHALSAAEIGNVNVRVLGYSYGAIQGSEFTRSLLHSRRGTLGYRISADMPVTSLVTIDPVNYTPQKHTDGPLANVQNFTSYFELNPSASTIRLLNKTTGQVVSSATYSDGIDPIGDTLPTSAAHSSQTLVDYSSWGSRVVTQYYNRSYNGSMKGNDVNHVTMPWYVFQDAVDALG